MRILRWSKFALNLLSYPFLNHSILSQIKKVGEELNCFYFSPKIFAQTFILNICCSKFVKCPIFSRQNVHVKNARFFPTKCLGTKATFNTLPTLQNNEPVPQVLKQVVNLSCLYMNGHIKSSYRNVLLLKKVATFKAEREGQVVLHFPVVCFQLCVFIVFSVCFQLI